MSLADDPTHFRQCHERWVSRLNRRMDEPGYLDEWYTQQCFSCRFFIPLVGLFIDDYGACSNPASPFDGLIMFEHDGCDHYVMDEEYDE